MLKSYRTVREVASVISQAADDAMEAYRTGRVTDEPNITDRFMGAIETRVNALPAVLSDPEEESFRIDGEAGSEVLVSIRRGIEWKAMTLRSSSGKAAEEKEFGADVLGVLSI